MTEFVCTACGFRGDGWHRFCGGCGRSVAPEVVAPGAPTPAPRAVRADRYPGPSQAGPPGAGAGPRIPHQRSAPVGPPPYGPRYDPPPSPWAPEPPPRSGGRRPWHLVVLLVCAAVLGSGAAVGIHLLTAPGSVVDTASGTTTGPAVSGGTAPVAGTSSSGAQQSGPTQSGPAQVGTRRVDLAAADGSGRPATGWTLRDGDTEVDCGYASPAAVSPGIQTCTPTAAAADVCWPAPGGQSVACMVDPWDHVLVRYRATGANVTVSPEADPDPVGLELADGTHCRLRNGGAWPGRTADPDLFGAYSCSDDDNTIVWGDDNSSIDKSGPTWTVQVGPPTGSLRTLPIAVAYYAATA